jgi:Legume lectin domain
MRPQLQLKIRSLLVFITTLLSVGIQCHADEFTYNDFSAPSALIFQADAKLVKSRVRLAPAKTGKAGGLWFSAKQTVESGFETVFRFQLTNRRVFGANGLAFVVQNNETPSLGAGGRGMGFRGISNSVVIRFNPYHWKNHHFVKYDEVTVLKNVSSQDNYRNNDGALGSATNAVFSDEKIHTSRIVYASGKITIFLDDLANPLLTVPVDLSDSMALDHGRAWVGFTAATGDDFYNHDIIGWSFNSSNAPITRQQSIVDSTPSSTRIYQGNESPTQSLATDPSFGHALPGEIGLTHQIEASTDLVHWAPVTNAVLYFKDPESTNYDRRFYRFLKK